MQRFLLALPLLVVAVQVMPVIKQNDNTKCDLNNVNEIKMTGDTVKKKDVVLTRIFDEPVASVWKAWSDPQLVMQWWGPTGFTSPVCKMDFREGGTTLVCMRAPKEWGGMDMYNTWSYTRIVTNEYIEYVFDWADKDGNRIDPTSIGMQADMPRAMRHTVTFKDLGNGKTEMTISEFGYPSDELVELSKAGLSQCLDKMAQIWK
jgi:uncharacterized protein YndB with AHSA1/START domain